MKTNIDEPGLLLRSLLSHRLTPEPRVSLAGAQCPRIPPMGYVPLDTSTELLSGLYQQLGFRGPHRSDQASLPDPLLLAMGDS